MTVTNVSVNNRLVENSKLFVNWFKEDALPLWSTKGIDPATGASFERFLANGDIDREVKPRVRVQARQIFTFCRAQELGWMDDAETVVSGLSDFAQKYGKHPSGHGYGHLLSPSYELIESHLDLYNHAFWLLASASRYNLYGDESALNQAHDLVQLLDDKFSGVCGGWLEGDYEAPCRRQNPHMHLFEAFMSLHEASGEACWLARAGEVFALFEARFFDEKHGVLREFFDNRWNLLDGELGDTIEPGHMFEWVWLLRWYERLTGRAVDTYANRMFEVGKRIGLAPSGLVYDAVSSEGKVLQSTKRCWPLIELIKACIVQAQAGDESAESLAAESLGLLLDKYICTDTAGLYIDQRDENDEICVDVAPASTLYHLIVCAEEVDRYVTERI